MKLEIELNPLNKAAIDTASISAESTDEVKELLRKGIKLAKDGSRVEARQSLLKVTELEPNNEASWLWLASISEYPEELLVFLQNVLKINPNNERALEWANATKSLLSKTFVQRGISASHENQKDFAKQCFLQAIVHDADNEMAWLWLASVSDSPEEKISHLQRVLSINPENETALSSFKGVKNQMSQASIKKAANAAFSGEHDTAKEILQDVLKQSPDSEEALILQAYISNSFEQKIACYEKVLDINPDNEAAKAGLVSLRAMLPQAAPMETSKPESPEQKEKEAQVAEELVQEPAPVAQPEAVEEENLAAEELQYSPIKEVPEEVAEDSSSYAETQNERPDNPTQELDENYEKRISSEWGTQSQEQKEAQEEAREEEVVKQEEPKQLSFEIVEDPAEDLPEAASEQAEELNFASTQDSNTAPIVMPEQQFDDSQKMEEQFAVAEAEEELADSTVAEEPKAETFECPFCSAENEQQNPTCTECKAMFSFDDMATLLKHADADQDVMMKAIERLEAQKDPRNIDSKHLIDLAVAHLNAKNPRKGFVYLNEALKSDPDNASLRTNLDVMRSLIVDIEEERFKSKEKETSSKIILVVDDSPTVRKLISGKLEKCGHSVLTAVDGMDALSKINEIVPDLVLLDITMPRLDGYQVCKLIRNNEATKEVPVVMISGKDGFFDKVRGRMAGTNGYITKPFGPDTLMKTIESYIK